MILERLSGLKNIFFIGFFGMLGVYSRYYLTSFLNRSYFFTFPFATFFINMLGCFLIGLVFSVASIKASFSPALKLGLMVGFLGGFTTFSSYCLESLVLLEKGDWKEAIGSLVLQPVLGLVLTGIGMILGRFI